MKLAKILTTLTTAGAGQRQRGLRDSVITIIAIPSIAGINGTRNCRGCASSLKSAEPTSVSSATAVAVAVAVTIARTQPGAGNGKVAHYIFYPPFLLHCRRTKELRAGGTEMGELVVESVFVARRLLLF